METVMPVLREEEKVLVIVAEDPGGDIVVYSNPYPTEVLADALLVARDKTLLRKGRRVRSATFREV